MTNVPNTPNPTPALPQGAPPAAEAPALPFSLPETMTAAQAEQRLVELRTDVDWQKRWMAGDKRAASEFDALTTLGAGQKPPAPKAEPENLVRPPAPPSASFYQFPSRVLDTPEATAEAAEARTVAFEHGITASEFTSIAEQQQNDASRFAG